MSSEKKEASKNEICLVCGAPDARINYSGLSCVPCKSFFIRATQVLYPYECHLKGNCALVPNEPGNCKGCRYRKCLEAGMDPHLVNRKTKYIGPVEILTIDDKVQLIQKHVMPMLSLGFHFVAGATCYMGPQQFARYYCGVDRSSIENVSTEDPNLAVCNLSVSLADVFLNSNLCYTYEESLPSSPSEMVNRMIPRGFCKFFTSFVDFATAVPELRYLSTADTMRLVQSNRISCVTLRSFYFNYVNAARGETEAKGALQVEVISKDHAALLKMFYTFYNEHGKPFMEEMQMSEEEMTLLRLVATVSPFMQASEEGKEYLRNARGKYTNILIGYQNEVYPTMPALARLHRLKSMLSFLGKLKVFSDDINRGTTALVLNNVNKVLGQLSYDLQVRVYTD